VEFVFSDAGKAIVTSKRIMLEGTGAANILQVETDKVTFHQEDGGSRFCIDSGEVYDFAFPQLSHGL